MFNFIDPLYNKQPGENINGRLIFTRMDAGIW